MAGHGNRNGVGLVLGFVLWAVCLALLYGFVQSQVTSSTLARLARAADLAILLAAGQSALDEASWVICHPPSGVSTVLEGLREGSRSGIVHEPVATRDLYRDLPGGNQVTIGAVEYMLVRKPQDASPMNPWLIDLSVRVSYRESGRIRSSSTRAVRRRHLARLLRVAESVGPRRRDEFVYAELDLTPVPLFETVDQ